MTRALHDEVDAENSGKEKSPAKMRVRRGGR